MIPPNRIKISRLKAGITQDQLMRLTEIHQSLLSRIERSYRQATPSEKKKIAEALGADPNCLFPETKDGEK